LAWLGVAWLGLRDDQQRERGIGMVCMNERSEVVVLSSSA